MENGILERYLLDELTDEEILAVEKALDNDPELKAYLIDLELSFERLAMENSIVPPSHLKSDLMQSVMHKVNGDNDDNINEVAEVVPARKMNTRFLVAASLAGLLLLNSVWLYNQWQSSQTQLEELQVETNSLKDQMESIESQLADSNLLLEAINSPEVEKYIMKGNDLSPTSVAIAYVNDESKSVVLNCKGLSELSDDQTYQMWADVEGEMINMGVIPKGVDMVELNYIDYAESLNITIEPDGGNDHPTVERLITNVTL